MSKVHTNRSVVVTGSTSGIGLGIAREGANVTLNGLGDAAAISALQAGIADEFGVKVRYSAADMTRPHDIAAMVDEAAAA
ncbi:MAG: hypothetical protein ACOVN2_02670, partial [Usitatibacteraceae bacterium]